MKPTMKLTSTRNPAKKIKMLRFFCGMFLCAALMACSSKVENMFAHAEEQRARGLYQEALNTYQKIIDLDPAAETARKAYLAMGDVYSFGLKNDGLALRIYGDLAKRGKSTDEAFQAQRNVAIIYHQRRRNFRQAILEYQHLLQDYPRHALAPEFQMAVADCYYALNDFNQARIEYLALASRYPKSAMADRARFQAAETYFMENQCKEAIETYNELLKKNPQSTFAQRARFGIANCEEDLGNYRRSQQLYTELLASYPNRAVIELKLQNLKKRMERVLPSAEEAAKAVAPPQEH